MKDIKVQCIVFTNECLRYAESEISVLDSLLKILKDKDIVLVFIQDLKDDLASDLFDYFSFQDKTCQVVYCRHYGGVWDILQNSQKTHTNQDLSLEEIVRLVQMKCSISIENTITIGASKQSLLLKNRSILHFYVGDKNHLLHKVRGLIPLTEQYQLGLFNIISYFSDRQFVDEAIDYHDIMKFIDKSHRFYASERAVHELFQKHSLVVKCLREKFQDKIVAIFGTGFPFYLLDGLEDSLNDKRTPNSILNYFKIQSAYFNKKIIDEKSYTEKKSQIFNMEDLDKINIFPLLNKFDAYKYEKLGYPVPLLEKTQGMSLEDYYLNNCFDISSEIWTCYYCSTLQNPDFLPHQLVTRNTNISCLSCKQTSFKLRNIMGHSADLDMVIIAKTNKHELADNIQNYITDESSYHLYDTKFYETFKENDGPIDLFVTDVSDLTSALKRLLLNDWEQVTFDSIALWSPNLQHDFQLGIDFALAFEPVFLNDIQLEEAFYITRQQFILKHGIEKIIRKLSDASFYTEQLLSNDDLVETLTNKLRKWCD
ncbi:MAG: hypothetical protein GVY04_14440 [Cyanobacteria bacterium]|jgi:hypothetical protein|nr:hypothetical protein [Cyanobacteria bacterium GSL.Bin1]